MGGDDRLASTADRRCHGPLESIYYSGPSDHINSLATGRAGRGMGRKQGTSQYRNIEGASRRRTMVEPGRPPSKDGTGPELPSSDAATAASDCSVESDGTQVASRRVAAGGETEPNATIKG